MILKISDLAIKKRYDSNIKPFSTEKATYLKCWIKSLIDSKYLWKRKEIDFENIWLRRYNLKKIWFWKTLKTWKKFDLKTNSSPFSHPGVKRPEWCTFWRLTPKMLPFWVLNAQPGTLWIFNSLYYWLEKTQITNIFGFLIIRINQNATRIK